jgi:hypothetical protein
MKQLTSLLLPWLPLAVLCVAGPLFIYAMAQQVYRQSANDPQIQIAEDTAAKLQNGASADEFVSDQTVNVADSLSPFIIIYDQNGKVIQSNAQLNGKTPELPQAVLSDMQADKGSLPWKLEPADERRFTWQPEPGVRLATIITQFDGKQSGFVLAGRNMREVERRIDSAMALAIAGTVGLLAATFAAAAASALVKRHSI